MRLLARKAFGRLRRYLTRIPDGPVRRSIGGVIFEHEYKPFLNRDDFKAMLTGTYDLALCDLLRRRLRRGDVVVDVGASVGYVSAVAGSLVGPSGEVHGFEPLRECFPSLERLRELNPDYQLAFQNVAVGDTPGSVTISFDPAGDSRQATLLPDTGYPLSYDVAVVRLDDYLLRHTEPSKVRLLKVDVEGFELPVLRGARRFLELFQPTIVCEVKPWELRKLGATMADFAEYVGGFGYKATELGKRKRMDLSTLDYYADVVLERT